MLDDDSTCRVPKHVNGLVYGSVLVAKSRDEKARCGRARAHAASGRERTRNTEPREFGVAMSTASVLYATPAVSHPEMPQGVGAPAGS